MGASDGAGFALVADAVLALDPINPQIAAKLLTSFGSWRLLEPGRGRLAREALERIRATPTLSRDVADIAARSVAG